jgi:hypothetical protein
MRIARAYSDTFKSWLAARQALRHGVCSAGGQGGEAGGRRERREDRRSWRVRELERGVTASLIEGCG